MTWHKSSFSGEDNCVEMPGTLDAVRDNKNPTEVMPGTPLVMRAFVRFVKADRFALPTS